jgi:hypothetical protein
MAVWLVKVLQEGMLGLGEALSYSEEPLDEDSTCGTRPQAFWTTTIEYSAEFSVLALV